MEAGHSIPCEDDPMVPKHRGEAYTDFEKSISSIVLSKGKDIPVCSIVFFPQGVPIEDDINPFLK